MACPKISYKTGSFWALIVAIKRAKLLFIFAFQWSHDINKRFKHFLLSGRLNLARNFLCQSHERRQLSKWWNSDEQLTLKNFAFETFVNFDNLIFYSTVQNLQQNPKYAHQSIFEIFGSFFINYISCPLFDFFKSELVLFSSIFCPLFSPF